MDEVIDGGYIQLMDNLSDYVSGSSVEAEIERESIMAKIIQPKTAKASACE